MYDRSCLENAIPGGLGSNEQSCQVALSEDICYLLMWIAGGVRPRQAGQLLGGQAGFRSSTALCDSAESFVSWLFFFHMLPPG